MLHVSLSIRLASLFYSQLLYEVPEEYNTVSYQGRDEAFVVSTASVARYLFKNVSIYIHVAS